MIDASGTLPGEGRMMCKRTSVFLALLVSAALSSIVSTSPSISALDPGGPFLVEQVIDGDTICLADNRCVRYLGINTPERGEPFWNEAKDYNTRKVKKRMVTLEFGEVQEDKYGRLLAYVSVKGEMVNAELLRAGLAHLFVLEPIQYYQPFQRLQEEARAKGLGIWGKGGFRGPLKITSLHADALGDDRVNLNGEYVRICNIASHDISLKGFSLADHEGHCYVFSHGLLRPGHTLLVLTGAGRDTVAGDQLVFYWGSADPIWNNKGDQAVLKDPQGAVVDTFTSLEHGFNHSMP
jgi:micrococcal nuclease